MTNPSLNSEVQLPGRIAVTSYGGFTPQIAAYFPEGSVVHSPQKEVPRNIPDVFALVPGIEPIDAALMDALPHLRLVQRSGVGAENVDLAAATERQIYVANVPSTGTGNAESVAELAIFHMMALGRRIREAQQNLRQSNWAEPEGQSLWGKTVGIYGLGGIGQAIATRLRPFGMRLLAIKRQPDPQLAATLGLEWLGTPDQRSYLLQESDFVVIAASASAIDRPFGKADIQQMRSGAHLINVSRGAWVDETALVQALQNGWIAGAGLDVFAQEPPDPRSPLLQDTLNVVLTPHIGGRTDAGYAGIAKAVAANIHRVAQGQAPENWLNLF